MNLLDPADKEAVQRRSYTAASELPWKLLKNNGCVVDGRILPKHIQLSPTNRCNANCSWCSCKNVNRQAELPLSEIKQLFDFFVRRGAKAVTITGGGEPTMHADIDEILHVAKFEYGLEIGLVTNGLCWSRPDAYLHGADATLTWLRISIVDPHSSPKPDRVEAIVSRLPHVACGISFTTPSNTNLEWAQAVCRLAVRYYNLTHIRFVQDILEPDDDAMNRVKATCEGITDKAIFQYRSQFTRGMTPCLISRLKPYIDATGDLFPCCGVQYARSEALRDLGKWCNMGNWRGFDNIEAFKGGICERCYYDSYNRLLQNMVTPLQHENFV